jgi:hypothetical protein
VSTLDRSLEKNHMKYVLLIYQAKDYDPSKLSKDAHKVVADQ